MIWAVSLLSMDLITHRLTAELAPWHSEFDLDQYLEMRPSPIQCSTSMVKHSTLALKLFRGEPAIAVFDWNFSASHNSSANFSTGVGSVLQLVSPNLQPGHG